MNAPTAISTARATPTQAQSVASSPRIVRSLMMVKIENQRAQQGAGHRSRHGQRDVHRCQAHDQPGEDDDRQKPDDESDPAPTAEGRIDPELVGEPPNVEVLPWEKEIDEEEHCSHEHQLCSAPEGVESLHAARPFVVVCGGLTGTLMHPGRSCKLERALS